MATTSDLLVLNWCDRATAALAVQRWHYARALPRHLYRIGVWEGGQLVGCVVFAACKPSVLRAHGLTDHSCELVRVALGAHHTPTSRILRIAVALLRRRWPDLHCIVAHCDPQRGHIGTIYQAAGWAYAGCLSYVGCAPRHCYILPFDAAIVLHWSMMAQAYPKHARAKQRLDAASGDHTHPTRSGRCKSDLPAIH